VLRGGGGGLDRADGFIPRSYLLRELLSVSKGLLSVVSPMLKWPPPADALDGTVVVCDVIVDTCRSSPLILGTLIDDTLDGTEERDMLDLRPVLFRT